MKRTFAIAAALAFTLAHCKKPEAPPPAPPPPAPAAAAPLPPEALPLGLMKSAAVIPADNPPTAEKIELGRNLYFDGRLSRDGTISCATCHSPKMGWTDLGPTSTGIGGRKGGRRSPTVINRLFSSAQFWDGRAPSLEDQAKGPIQNPIEMGFTHEETVARLSKIPAYGELFKKAFGDEKITLDRLAQAIASFERTLVSGNSPFDRWQKGDEAAVGEDVKRGWKFFRETAKCSMCHAGFNFTDELYHNLGVGVSAAKPDLGRYETTKQAKDKGAFKTPTLREAAGRAPYMHDGSEKTLESVMDFYAKGGVKNPRLDPFMKPFAMTDQDRADLVALMKSLSGEVTQVQEPAEFPGGWKPGMPPE